ncbi:hypothetical protein C5468_24055 [Photorhabdus luminescens subsp. mexicana]|uniref:Uncharacterized protein n=1 Tax=Photorhabdus luminescens subsp. mexicana TaxID=2100167 RepID=A0A4R4IR88_PHOLU|nr:hypothetical protein C5468_24055 [Photorhabdus luminescens subsp. mexicana]
MREIPLLGSKKQRDDIISLTRKDEAKLKKAGFESARTSIEQRNSGLGFISVVCLKVSGQEFFKHFTAKAITARRETGRQYIAGIATDAEEHTREISFGFILVGNSDCRVFKTTPKKPRADSLEKIAIRLELPVDTDFEFFKYNR